MNDFIENLNNRLSSSVFSVIEKKEFKLEEKDQYTVEVICSEKDSIIVIKPPEMKKQSMYLIQNKLPKDCDYILISPQNKVLFLIELKSKGSTATESDVKKQLIAGKKWFEHILFVTNNLSFIENKEFRVIPIWIRVYNKTDFKTYVNCKPRNNIYRSNGKYIDLRNFYRDMQCHITFDNFDNVLNIDEL